MKNSLLLFLFITLLFCNSCKKADVIEIPIIILLDHKLISDDLTQNDSLTNLLTPYNYKDDSILVSTIFTLSRIDLPRPVNDSIINQNIFLKDAQKWLIGGKKNPNKLKNIVSRQLKQQLQQKKIRSEFLIIGSDQYTDTFIRNNNFSSPIVYSKNLLSYDWAGKQLKIFSNIDSIKDYLITETINLKNQGSDIGKIIILFEPKSRSLKAPIPGPPSGPIEKVNTDWPAPGPKPEPQPPVSPTYEMIDSRINVCQTKNGNEKINYFFYEIFRSVKSSQRNTNEYKSLIKDIANILIDNFPNKSTQSYYFACTSENDFLTELEKYKIVVNINQLKNKFSQSCP